MKILRSPKSILKLKYKDINNSPNKQIEYSKIKNLDKYLDSNNKFENIRNFQSPNKKEFELNKSRNMN